MLTYNSRTTKFINLDYSEGGDFLNDAWLGLVEGRDVIMYMAIEISAESKVITRTRRKFWDDVSLRGGQYSAVMILLTALYSLFQGPF